MTYGGRFFYVNILLIVKCVMKLFHVIAKLRNHYNVVFVWYFIRHCESLFLCHCESSLCFTSLRGFVVFHVIARLRRHYNVVFVWYFIRHCEASLCFTSLRGFAEAVAICKIEM